MAAGLTTSRLGETNTLPHSTFYHIDHGLYYRMPEDDMRTLLIWENVPEETTAYILDGTLGELAADCVGLYGFIL